MNRRRFRFGAVLFLTMLLCLAGTLAYAQGGAGSTTLSGAIVDTSGGVIPGADVVAKDKATATEYRAVSDTTGRFTITAIPPGNYTVTITMMGFKTVVLPDVTIITGTPASVKTTVLEVGKLEETVTVTGATEIVQTQSAQVSTTLTTTQITRQPLATRNTLDFITNMPGVNATGAARNATVMGLPGAALNITIDGLNTQDQALKGTAGSAMFTYINPRLDAVEEVTVSTANPGAESSGQGAVQIKFQTRSGTNKFQGSWYHYMRRTQWNTPYWFNTNQNDPPKPADPARVDTFGGRIGGPIIKDKAFFFFNYEEFRQPLGTVRSRTVLTPASYAGCMVYNGAPTGGAFGCASGPGIDLYKLAAANGQVSTPDSAIGQMLSDINKSLTMSGSTVIAGTSSVSNTLNFSNSATQRRVYPTTRVDVNVTPNNRVGLSFYIQRFISQPDLLNSRDPAFPGYTMQGNQTSWRPSLMGNWRSVLGPNLVNEVRMGYMGWKGTHFSDNITADQFPGGKRLSWPLSLSTPYSGSNWEIRSAPNLNVEDSLNWIKGKHTLTFGGSFTQVGYNDLFQYYVPFVGIGFNTTYDPAASMFSTTNFPGANSTDISNARGLYALLTGRVTSLNNTAYLDPASGQYQYMGPWQYWVHQNEYGFYVQDSWKLKPNLTLTGGVRYELQMPFTAANHFFTQLGDANGANFNMLYGLSGPGNYFYSGGTPTGNPNVSVIELAPGQAPFHTDKNNFAPSVGIAWRVPVNSSSFWSKILSSDPVVRGGYSRSYVREGMSTTADIFGYNPGGQITASRNVSLGNLIEPGGSWPLLYRETSRLGPPAFANAPAYPLTPAFTDSINAFYPDTQTPWVHSFNLSFQRSITKDTAIDVRYVGTRARGGWVDGGRNINELNIVENGFTTEYLHAQQNYLINEQTYGWGSKAGNSFAYKGLPGQYPLPIFQGFYSGNNATAGDPAAYTSGNYTNTDYLNYLTPTSQAPGSLASPMFSDSSMRANGIKAGYPANFFYMNPAIGGGAYVTGRPEDRTMANYDALQIELRRRMNQGLLLAGSYQYIFREESSFFLSQRVPAQFRNFVPNRSEGSPLHSFKMNWVYELPFGQGKKWGSNVSRGWNRLVGGWSFDGTGRLQSGPRYDFGNVRLVGFTDADLQAMYKLRFEPDSKNPNIMRVYMLPADVINNTMLAYATTYASSTGYSGPSPTGRYFAPINTGGCIQAYSGGCIQGNTVVPSSLPIHHYVTGPRFVRFDMSIAKRLDITSRIYGELRIEALNVFDTVNFTGNTAYGSTTYTAYQVTGAYRDLNNTQDPGGRLLQFSYRISF